MAEEKTKVFVGNLDYGLTEDELKDFFVEKGIQVKTVAIIKDKYSGKSKGFGFVELGSEEEVQKAIELLNDNDLKGRKLKVNKASKPKERF